MYHLYVKTHNITKLQYLGYTTRDPFKYRGSGKYWKRHIIKYKNDVTTEVIGTYETRDQLTINGMYYSKLWNIVESDNWANLMNETGIGSGIGRKHSEATKLKMNAKKFGRKQPQSFYDKVSKQYLITDPNGDSFVIHNLTKYCRENGLNNSSMARIATGTKYYHSHRGYKCEYN